eukprot:gene4360-3171_t
MSFVFMVEPLAFGSHPEIVVDNKFITMPVVSSAQAGSDEAQAFNLLRELECRISYEGVPAKIIRLSNEPKCSILDYDGKGDAIFPNNSISFHNFTDEEGRVVRRLAILYPMSRYRRGELPKRQVLDKLKALAKQRDDVNLLDLRQHESEGMALEGTGALVFSHDGKYVYMARSGRSDEKLLNFICQPEYLDIPPQNRFVFDAALPRENGEADPVYHTNVMGWCGKGICAWCIEAMEFPTAAERERFHDHLAKAYDKVISLSVKEVRSFAGNAFEFASRQYSPERRFLCMSSTAWEALEQEHVAELAVHYGQSNIFHFFSEPRENSSRASGDYREPHVRKEEMLKNASERTTRTVVFVTLMKPGAVEPSYDYNDLLMIEERQKLVVALERLDEASMVAEQDPPTPLYQYRFLARLLHVEPCEEYVAILESNCSSSGMEDRLTELNFKRAYVGHTHWIAIFLTLPKCVYLQKLNVAKQRLSSVLIQFMCDALVHLPALYSIDVSYNPFGSTGVKHLTNLARRKPNLVFCGFSGIHCISKLGRQLEEAIGRNRIPFLEAAKKVAEEKKAAVEAEAARKRNETVPEWAMRKFVSFMYNKCCVGVSLDCVPFCVCAILYYVPCHTIFFMFAFLSYLDDNHHLIGQRNY